MPHQCTHQTVITVASRDCRIAPDVLRPPILTSALQGKAASKHTWACMPHAPTSVGMLDNAREPVQYMYWHA